MKKTHLEDVAHALVVAGKGILAADESLPTIKKRFDAIAVESTEENRRAYRELLFTTPDLASYISGVILFDETLRQRSTAGDRLAQILADAGIHPGIKVDKGAKALALGYEGEKATEGLDGLRERLVEYRELGAVFAKWRAVYSITDRLPSRHCIRANAEGLARYAALCQETGCVPIVEPEVLMEGDHSLERSAEVTQEVLVATFHALLQHNVALEGLLLKPNMVLAGYGAPKASTQEVAESTLAVLRRAVPAAVPGIVFLSGGQSDEDATAHLDAMNRAGGHKPWRLSFSYGRALQAPALKAWRGVAANVQDAQLALYKRARLNGAATSGAYESHMEAEG